MERSRRLAHQEGMGLYHKKSCCSPSRLIKKPEPGLVGHGDRCLIPLIEGFLDTQVYAPAGASLASTHELPSTKSGRKVMKSSPGTCEKYRLESSRGERDS